MTISMIRQAVNIFKLRIGVSITMAAMAGLAITPGPAPTTGQILVLACAVLLASASAGGFNQYFERDVDGLMARTANRPFVTGEHFLALKYWPLILSLMLAGSVLWAAVVLNAAVALHLLLGALVYGVVYTVWLKRRSSFNIVVGGLAGSFAVLAGAAAVDPVPGPLPLLLAGVLFLWTPAHFWSLAIARREQYARAGIPMLPVVVGNPSAALATLLSSVAVVAMSLLPVLYGMGWIYLTGAAAGGAYLLARSVQLARNPTPQAAMTNFIGSLIQLSLLQLAIILEALL
jgi:protoheme IX farnesyltransferase